MKIDLKKLGSIARAVAPIILPIIPAVRRAVKDAGKPQAGQR